MAAEGQALAVVPAAAGFDVFSAARAVAKADAVQKAESDIDSIAMQAEEPVPAEWVWMLLRRAKMEAYCTRLVFYVIFIALFTAVFQSIRPVTSTFAVQDSLLEQTVRRPISGSCSTGFYDISSDAAWFQWVEVQLLPTILNQNYFNGDARNASWGRRFASTVSMYNTQTAPVRFRQARVTDDSCGTPAGSSALARPCWGDFSSGNQFKQAFGEAYGNRYLTDLNAFGAGGIHSYGSEAHVIDMQLDLPFAQMTLQRMKQDLWLNEQTRVVAVETNWYNANLDLSTYCRWQVDISPGGRFTPYVVIYSCRLSPYSTTLDMLRLVAEVVFVFMLLYFVMDAVVDIRLSKEAYFFSLWNWLELVNLLLYIVIVAWWLAYVFKDKAPFEVQSTDTYASRPDLSKVAGHYDALANLAGFNIVFSYIKVFKYLQIFPSLGLFWQTLRRGARDIWPFLLVFISFTCGFAFAGHWMFGLRMVEFHSWPRSFMTLFLTIVTDFPYEDMKQVAPLGGVVFTAAWVLVMVMVLANMFVAILTEWYHREEECHEAERTKLQEKIGDTGIGHPFHDSLAFLYNMMGFGKGGRDGGYREHAKEVRKMLGRADLRKTDHLREAVIDGRPLLTRELSSSFRGDLNMACGFAREVQIIAAEAEATGQAPSSGRGGELKGKEREELLRLQGSVERMEDQLRLLRSALHESNVAPSKVAEPEPSYGYNVQVAGPRASFMTSGSENFPASPPGARVMTASTQGGLPGSVPE